MSARSRNGDQLSSDAHWAMRRSLRSSERKQLLGAFADPHSLLPVSQPSGCQQGSGSLEAFIRGICQRADEQPALSSLLSVGLVAHGSDGFDLRDAVIRGYARQIRERLRPVRDPMPEPFALTIAGGLLRVIDARARDRIGACSLSEGLTDWTRAYHPVPTVLAVEPPRKPRRVDPNRLAGGRAPGTLALSSHGCSPCSSASCRAHERRERVLDAVAQINAEFSPAALTTGAIVKRAGVSLGVFCDEFKDGEDAFKTALELGHTKGQALVARTRAGTAPWPDSVLAAIRGLFEFFSLEPCFARLALIDAPCASPDIARRAGEHAAAYARLLFDEGPESRTQPALIPEAITHGLFELVCRHLAQGRIAELPRAFAHGGYLALAPLLGPTPAARAVSEQDTRAR
jgi:AcrR family transcriptional regulator